ncbi:hypothetical protein AJ80_02763 [Polytolypa hystricis UAMH7299]|uniref:Uncharacterized protein n=1 Tax=Polytolypa hystricis (strain UAMH7299) TaxID=1447883 RepID=A0A2B7YQ72_POLH7|nr:hypothetical protein AJ80_02763 [Polytolypa hystricis UAMH7299]
MRPNDPNLRNSFFRKHRETEILSQSPPWKVLKDKAVGNIVAPILAVVVQDIGVAAKALIYTFFNRLQVSKHGMNVGLLDNEFCAQYSEDLCKAANSCKFQALAVYIFALASTGQVRSLFYQHMKRKMWVSFTLRSLSA